MKLQRLLQIFRIHKLARRGLYQLGRIAGVQSGELRAVYRAGRHDGKEERLREAIHQEVIYAIEPLTVSSPIVEIDYTQAHPYQQTAPPANQHFTSRIRTQELAAVRPVKSPLRQSHLAKMVDTAVIATVRPPWLKDLLAQPSTLQELEKDAWLTGDTGWEPTVKASVTLPKVKKAG